MVSYTAGNNLYSVAVGDFNGDGKTDMAVANEGSNTASILLGNGNGTFQAAVNLGADAATGSTGAVGSTTQAIFSDSPILVKGLCIGNGPTLTSVFADTANVFITNSGDATEAATITFDTQTLSPGG